MTLQQLFFSTHMHIHLMKINFHKVVLRCKKVKISTERKKLAIRYEINRPVYCTEMYQYTENVATIRVY